MFPKRMTAAVVSVCVLTVLASACSSDDKDTTTTINGSPIVSSPTVDTTGGLDTLPVDTLGS